MLYLFIFLIFIISISFFYILYLIDKQEELITLLEEARYQLNEDYKLYNEILESVKDEEY